jgi:hypothetical protein
MISLGGVRPVIDMASVAPGASAAASYTITSAGCRRCLVVATGITFGDIRINVNKTADASDWPLIGDAYYSVAVEKDDTVNVFNTSAGAITVYFLETY